jgi:hypothetical protein
MILEPGLIVPIQPCDAWHDGDLVKSSLVATRVSLVPLISCHQNLWINEGSRYGAQGLQSEGLSV